MTDEPMSPEQLAVEALDAALQSFIDYVAFEKGKDLRAALERAVSAYELAQWQPLGCGNLPTFRDIMVKEGFWRYKPVPSRVTQQSLVAPNATGPFLRK